MVIPCGRSLACRILPSSKSRDLTIPLVYSDIDREIGRVVVSSSGVRRVSSGIDTFRTDTAIRGMDTTREVG